MHLIEIGNSTNLKEKKNVNYPQSKIIRRHYTKIMLLESLRLEEAI